MQQHIKGVARKYRYSMVLLRQLVISDFKLRYQASVLGYLWSVLKPLALFAVLYLVFGVFLSVSRGVPNFPVYLLVGVVLWNFFVEVTNGSTQAIVGRASLIRKINFPKYVIILATTFSALINLGINLVIVGVFIYFTGVELRIDALLVPVLLLELFALALGFGFLLSALFVRYRDVNFIWEVIVQAAFYATPIIYPVSLLPIWAAKVLLLSPVAQVVQDVRYLLVTDQTMTVSSVYGGKWSVHLIPILLSILMFVAGALFFKKRSPHFAEEV